MTNTPLVKMSEDENVLQREMAIIDLRDQLAAAGNREVEAVIAVLFNPSLALSKDERDKLLKAAVTLGAGWSWISELLDDGELSDVVEVVRLWVRDPFVAYRDTLDDFFQPDRHREEYVLHTSTKDLEATIAHYQRVLEVCEQYGITEWWDAG